VLLVIRASAAETETRTGAVADAMEDHVQKLFWALWSPTQADWISGGQINEFRELARAMHERRKSGLYFDPAAAVPPREAVTAEETQTVIGLAEARLGMETTKRWAPVGSEQAENAMPRQKSADSYTSRQASRCFRGRRGYAFWLSSSRRPRSWAKRFGPSCCAQVLSTSATASRITRTAVVPRGVRAMRLERRSSGSGRRSR
jgi:hypothetical protein